MSTRVTPSQRVRAEIDHLFGSDRELGAVLEEVGRLGVRLLMQTAMEAEFTEFLGRERYARGERAREGSRNGYQEVTRKTTAGPVTLHRPRSRGTSEPFASRLLGKGITRTNALESLVISGFVRGLSVRDVEAALEEALGPGASVSRSTVSRICEAIKVEFEAWRTRRLDDVELAYLYLDGSAFKMHKGSRAEPVLCARGITVDGAPVFIGLAPASDEGTDPWVGFLEDLRDRGLRPPLLGISDGAPGLIDAFEAVYGVRGSLRQRCVIHRCRNVIAKVPKHAKDEVKAAFWAIFKGIDAPPGEQAMAVARERAERFCDRYGGLYPAAVACLRKDFDDLITYLRFPAEHWDRIRHSNFIERTFGETRRRVKVIGRLPGEQSCLSLVWAVLDRAARGWRGVTMTPAAIRLLADLKRQLLGARQPARAKPARSRRKEVRRETVTPAA